MSSNGEDRPNGLAAEDSAHRNRDRAVGVTRLQIPKGAMGSEFHAGADDENIAGADQDCAPTPGAATGPVRTTNRA
ncbi:MAG: hypothetical protein ACR2P2_22965 [Nakamurella sp.]